MAMPWKIRRTVDLEKWEQKAEHLGLLAYTGAKNAHHLILTVFENDKPVSFDGYNVRAYFLRSGEKVMIQASVTSNVIAVKFPAAAYAIQTRVSLVVRAENTEDMIPLYGAVFDLACGDEPVTVDPDDLVMDISELLAEVDDMRAATADSKAATAGALTAAQEARNTATDVQIQMDAYKVTVDGALSAQKDMKADAIMDTSARAASHSLHAQDGRMHVTLYGATTETGTGDKSPENPYTISGVGAADIHVGGKNLIPGWVDGHIGSTTGIFFDSSYPAVRTDHIPIQPGKPYTFSGQPTDVFNMIALYDAEKKFVRRTTGGTTSPRVLKANETAGCYYAAIAQYLPDASTTGTPNTTTAQFESGTDATPYEPYNANTYALPLLPDNSPLMGNGTVNDTVENDVASGCDVCITFNSADGWKNRNADAANVFSYSLKTPIDLTYSDTLATDRLLVAYASGVKDAAYDRLTAYRATSSTSATMIYLRPTGLTTLDELNARLAANPLKIFYRSTEYTPDRELRVAQVVRRCKRVTVTSVTGEHASHPGLFAMKIASNDYANSTPDDSCNIFAVSGEKWSTLPDLHVRYITWADARFKWVEMAGNIDGVNAYLAEHPLEITLPLKNPEIYVTDAVEARKPSGIMPVTVTGTGETSVTYPHDTKHYTDSQHDSLARSVEEIAGRVGEMEEGAYELISSVTTTEEVAIIDIPFDDGYKRIKADVHTKQTTNNRAGVISVWGKPVVYAGAMTDTRGEKDFAVDMEYRNGYAFANAYGGGLGSENDLQYEGEARCYPRAIRGYVPESHRVSVTLLSGAVFPIGTTVTVEGVR